MSEMDRRPPPAPTEACCDRCGETFAVTNADELMHFQRRSGDLCGGDGAPIRKYVIRRPNRG
jgi:hypothetical protein